MNQLELIELRRNTPRSPSQCHHGAQSRRQKSLMREAYKPTDLKWYWQESCRKKTNDNSGKTRSKWLPKAQSRLCPDSQISSAIIPAQSPAAHNQPHETGAWVVAHALGLETDPTDRWVFSVHWVDFIMKTFLGILAFINHVWKGIVSLTRQYFWYHPKKTVKHKVQFNELKS